MDTISRENNSLLPAIGVAVGAVALILAAVSVVGLSKAKTQLAAHEQKLATLDDIASQAAAASTKADQVKTSLDAVAKGTNDAFAQVGSALTTMQAQIKALQETHVAHATKGGRGGPVVAGPGEYVVKPGDSLMKIARANGTSLRDLEAVNPGVDSKHLHVGQKIKLPEKEGASAASAPAADASAAPAAAPAAQ